MTVRITEAELARDIRAVLMKVRSGIEVIVEQDHRPVAVIKSPQGPGRKISECIALVKAHEDKLGYAPVPDPEFAKDVQAAMDSHREPLEPAFMGLVLDSGVLIDAERRAYPVSELLAMLEIRHGETEIALSAITVIELEHGLYRANTEGLARKRRDYLDAVFAAIPVVSFTMSMAQSAAKIEAEAKQGGRVIPFPDLLIGVTALHFDYAVGARNLRHFRMIPELNVIEL